LPVPAKWSGSARGDACRELIERARAQTCAQSKIREEQRMPTLNWIGKEAVVKHHKDVPYRLVEPITELSCGEASSGNLIVQGDNLPALKMLGWTLHEELMA
jgi:hypothetical protein